MALMRIRLELARTPTFPAGSSKHGYEFIAPLTKDDHIDAEAWRGLRKQCTVIRFWGDEPVETGLLRHVGRGWRFDYDEEDDADDEPFFKLDKHVMTPGSYVSLTERDGEQNAFRIVSVMPVPGGVAAK
ncbi:MAG: hypothetical protein IID54_05885 [Proteobacteria bacterium]|nr:hypothetical protein [Pseudomonadota bacterium]